MCFFNNDFGFDFAKDLSPQEADFLIDKNTNLNLDLEIQQISETKDNSFLETRKEELFLEEHNFLSLPDQNETIFEQNLPFFDLLNSLESFLGCVFIKNSDVGSSSNTQNLDTQATESTPSPMISSQQGGISNKTSKGYEDGNDNEYDPFHHLANLGVPSHYLEEYRLLFSSLLKELNLKNLYGWKGRPHIDFNSTLFVPHENTALRLFKLELRDSKTRPIYYAVLVGSQGIASLTTDLELIDLYEDIKSGKKNVNGKVQKTVKRQNPNQNFEKRKFPISFNTINGLVSIGLGIQFRSKGLEFFNNTKKQLFSSASQQKEIGEEDSQTNQEQTNLGLDISQLFITGASGVLIEICRRLLRQNKKSKK